MIAMCRIIQARIRWYHPDKITAKRHRNRIDRVLIAIETEYPRVQYPEQIRLNHIKWVRSEFYMKLAVSSKTLVNWDESLKILVLALNRQDNWYYELFGCHCDDAPGRGFALDIVRAAKFNRKKLRKRRNR